MHRRLEKDAWLDIFPDSDAGGGQTNIEGPEIILSYRLAEDADLVVDYYGVGTINGTINNSIQFDLITKF